MLGEPGHLSPFLKFRQKSVKHKDLKTDAAKAAPGPVSTTGPHRMPCSSVDVCPRFDVRLMPWRPCPTTETALLAAAMQTSQKINSLILTDLREDGLGEHSH